MSDNNSFVYPSSDRGLPLWPRIRHKIREPLAEFLGTMLIILFGDGVVAQVVLSSNKNGAYQSISWCWGIGVMFGIYASGGISGAHLNPAVSFANAVFRGFPWKKLPAYIFAQLLGAFVGALIVYANYKSAFDMYEGHNIRTVLGDKATAGVFCTYPAAFMTRTGMFFSEVIASSLLMLGIYAINDDNNIPAGNLGPLIMFFLIFGLGAAFGWETGYAINPARDFGPRLASLAVGYGSEVFSAGGWYFWIPIVAPFIGCTLGGFLYDLLVFTGAESPVNMPYMGFDRYKNLSLRNKNAHTGNGYEHDPKIVVGTVHGHTDHQILGTHDVVPITRNADPDNKAVQPQPQHIENTSEQKSRYDIDSAV